MALNSIITDTSAQVALNSLNNISAKLATTQKAVSTGYIVADATDNGASLIGDTTAAKTDATYRAVTVASDEQGDAITFTAFSGSTILTALSFTSTELAGAATVAGSLATSGTFTTSFNNVSTGLNTYGNLTNPINNQISFNTSKITSLQTGLGALVDANEAQESATLQSLRIQQQLATSSLSIAEQTPSFLTKLIR